MADDNIRKFRHGKDEDGIALPDDPDELAAELARRKPRGRGARGMLSVVGGLWREKEEQMQKIGQNAYKRAVIGNTARQAGRAARDEATGYVEEDAAAAAATTTAAGLRFCCARHDCTPADVLPLLLHYCYSYSDYS